MKKALQFSEFIQSTKKQVWDELLGQKPYQIGSAEFCADSHFRSTWAQGEKKQWRK